VWRIFFWGGGPRQRVHNTVKYFEIDPQVVAWDGKSFYALVLAIYLLTL
jgi:hypothetical protein